MDSLALVAIIAYAAASALFLAVHLGGGPAAGKLGRHALLLAVAVELVDIGVRCFRLQHPLSSTAEATAFFAWVLSLAFLVAAWKYRLEAAGAFSVSASLVLLVLSRVLPGDAPTETITPLGTAHILLATLGLAAFALAAALAIVYLVQERRLKRTRVLPVNMGAGRRASLETLDRLAARCVTVGFPILTLTIVTGAIWVARLGLLAKGSDAFRPEYLLSVASWIAFGVLLLVRAAAGWQGRRAAWLTLGGFAGSLLVLAAYFLRHAI